MRFGPLLIGAGFLMMFTGAGTSDMEMAIGENVRAFTGLPLAVLGLITLAAGMWLLAPGDERQSEKPEEKKESRRQRAS